MKLGPSKSNVKLHECSLTALDQSCPASPLPVVLVLPLVGDLVGAVVPVSVRLVHDAGVEAADHLGDDPLDVVHDGVGVGVGGDVLVVGRLPEGDHVLPDGAIHNVSTQRQNIFYMKQIFLVVIFFVLF